jgi:metallo-beta-lactamase family protein
MEGEKVVRIFGEDKVVRCNTRSIRGYSAHGDQIKLLSWLRPMKSSIKKLYLVQSEDEAATAFAAKVRDELAIDAQVPVPGMVVDLL